MGELTALEQKMKKLAKLVGQQKSAILRERIKSAG
jgi:predicted DNA-binding protein